MGARKSQRWHGCNTPHPAPSRHQERAQRWHGCNTTHPAPSRHQERAQRWHGCNTPCLAPSRHQERAQRWHGCNTPCLAPSRHQAGRKGGTGAILHTRHHRGTRNGRKQKNRRPDGRRFLNRSIFSKVCKAEPFYFVAKDLLYFCFH